MSDDVIGGIILPAPGGVRWKVGETGCDFVISREQFDRMVAQYVGKHRGEDADVHLARVVGSQLEYLLRK